MSKNNISILSTVPLERILVDKMIMLGIEINVIPFIETIPLVDAVLRETISDLYKQDATVVFTSTNAVNTVASISEENNNWVIYCIGRATRQLISERLGEDKIVAVADNATELAQLIIKSGEVNEVLFFCGDKRREELPKQLTEAGIKVKEITVYKTIATPQQVNRQYDAILFFSPTGVESFCSLNTIDSDTILFAIGNTTAAALRGMKNKVIVSSVPGKEDIVNCAIEYFKMNEKATHE